MDAAQEGRRMTCLATITTSCLAVLFVGMTSLLQPVPKLIWNASASVPIGLSEANQYASRRRPCRG